MDSIVAPIEGYVLFVIIVDDVFELKKILFGGALWESTHTFTLFQREADAVRTYVRDNYYW